MTTRDTGVVSSLRKRAEKLRAQIAAADKQKVELAKIERMIEAAEKPDPEEP